MITSSLSEEISKMDAISTLDKFHIVLKKPNLTFRGREDLQYTSLEVEEVIINPQDILDKMKSDSVSKLFIESGLSENKTKEIRKQILKGIEIKAKERDLDLSDDTKEAILHTIFLAMKRTSESLHK